MLKKCPVCGKPIDFAASQCKFCNSYLIDPNKKVIWQSEPLSKKISLGFKIKFLIISAILILVMSFGIYSYAAYSDERDWKFAVAQNNIETYKKYINIHKSGKHIKEAFNILDDCCWQKAIALNTEKAYLYYLLKHPKGKYTNLAKRNADELAWKKACESGDKKLIENYIKNYPNGIFIECAKFKLKNKNLV
jgi:hypothetical protein